MISPSQIHRRARLLGVDDAVIWREYVSCHVLAGIAETSSGLVFRGGTALARVHWPDHRISEDLDFITERTWEHVTQEFDRAIAHTQLRLETTLSIASPASDASRLRHVVRSDLGEILIDVVQQAPVRRVVARLDLPYGDLPGDLSVDVVAVEEILADKWFMLEDRDEPRDLFDLWTGLTSRGLAFGPIAELHTAKYGHAPMIESLTRAKRLAAGWDVRLAHQIPHLPDFTRVLEDVTRVAKSWLEAGG